MISNLENELRPLLQKAKDLYIATALMNKSGYDFIKENLLKGCVCNFIVGVDLPTPPSVLEELMTSNQNGLNRAKIYYNEQTYHPKVYILRTIENTLIAFVGSANTTSGGLSKNVEMTVKIVDQKQCENLIEWFQYLFSQSFELSKSFIDKYKATFKRIKSRQASNFSDIKSLANTLGNTPQNSLRSNSGQFFKDSHFNAYSQKYWYDYLDAANEKRKSVKEKFKVLHNEIYRQFKDYGIDELKCHHHKQNIVSLHFKNSFNNGLLDAMWLQYGYSQKELGDSLLLQHPRVQIILRHDHIGIWLLIGKDNSSIGERQKLKKNMKGDLNFRELFYQQIRNLGGSYWISNGGIEDVSINEFESSAKLSEYIEKDDFSKYFIIGRTYSPSDSTLSEQNISDTVLVEFQRLFPIYKMIKI